MLPFQSYGLMDSRAEGCVDGIIVLITITTAGAAIDTLTEDNLLQIFDFHSDMSGHSSWHALVYVCRRWRNIVFCSSRYLDLLLLCTPTTPVRESLHIWPPLPIVVDCELHSTSGWDNVVTALEQNDRVCEVTLLDLSFLTLEAVHISSFARTTSRCSNPPIHFWVDLHHV